MATPVRILVLNTTVLICNASCWAISITSLERRVRLLKRVSRIPMTLRPGLKLSLTDSMVSLSWASPTRLKMSDASGMIR